MRKKDEEAKKHAEFKDSLYRKAIEQGVWDPNWEKPGKDDDGD